MTKHKDLKIIFMGTPDFAVTILDRLLQDNRKVIAVVTAPDKPAGRGRKLHPSPVKKFALEFGLPVLQPANLKEITFLKTLKTFDADLQIVVAFRMLPKVVWSMPKQGTFNLHASLLPKYRGAAPIHWAIIYGEKETGVTTFFIDQQIDTGAIILAKKIPISQQDTAGTLHDKLMYLGADLVLETVDKIAQGEVITKVQQVDTNIKYAPKISKATAKINWHHKAVVIHNFIRGMSPSPTAWSTFYSNGNKEIIFKIYKSDYQIEKHFYKVGSVIQEKKSLKIAVLDGFIYILKIQLSGKRVMDTKDLLNGFQLTKNTMVN